ncbi:MAG: aminotransferase class V-fold PLP-dependent enzyme [Alphaproteobacteria bacterium]|nr:aminotransferase class V-fold PLP-dependent enzyme [Alphaproteobacteria bacterium]
MSGGQDGYGRRLLAEFALDPGFTHLNQGSFGALPNEVAAAEAGWRRRIEGNPTRFLAFELPGQMRRTAGEIAAFLGGSAGDWALVENATAGANAVIAALALRPGEKLLATSHVYNAVRNTLRHHAARAGAEYVELPVPVPYPGDEALLEQIGAALDGRVRIAVFDHVSSHPATILPVRRLVELCHGRGVPVLIDGAHAPGLLALDVPALGADWYVGNLHKWAFAPRGTAALYVAEAWRASLHPPGISHGYGQGFPLEFDWTGTRDFSGWLAAPEGIGFWRRAGGEHLMDRNRALARTAAEFLAAEWRTELAAPAQNLAAMATIRLPWPGEAGIDQARALFHRLVEEQRIVAPVFSLAGALWLRISAQIYNEADDYQRLAEAIRRLVRAA